MVLAAPLGAQAAGAVAGRVRDAATGRGIAGAIVAVDGGRQGASTDTAGYYRVRAVRSGWHRVQVSLIGYRPIIHDSVLVLSGETVTLNFALTSVALQLESLVVQITPDRVLDPMVPQDLQRITGDEIRRLPVSTVEEAVALSAGAVGESYRGGRLGQQAFVLDGLGVKNQLDASTGPLGLRIPPDLLTEASLVTNAFSARYGQAISGLVNVVTKDGGDRWEGRTAYETDRPLPEGWDYGTDRFVASGDGPLGHGIGVAGVLDVEGRLDADPVNAPATADPHDPRFDHPSLLPHNSGERYDAGLKITAPLGERQTVRLFGLRSIDQRLLFDPAFKYDPSDAPARRVGGTLLTLQLQHTAGPKEGSVSPLTLDLRAGYFDRTFMRGTLAASPDSKFGAFTFSNYHFLGEDLAVRQDTIAARAAVPGFTAPDWSEHTPWGVPAFFLGDGSRGEIAWNRFRELRTQVDLTMGSGKDIDFYLGGEFARQRVQTFQRVFAYLPIDSTVPPPTASDFQPVSAAVYAETQVRVEELAFTIGMRYDQFDGRAPPLTPGGRRFGPARSLNPRIAVSTVLQGATFVASIGRFSQAPDFQYLVDAAFDDTLRTGRFRRGNPSLGYEDAIQYEFSLRLRPTPLTAVRGNLYVKRLDGLVASVPLGTDPDSSIFGNSDFGTVKGFEVILEREPAQGWGIRASYTLQFATATATNAFQILRRIRVDTLTGDTISPARVEFPLDYDRRHSVSVIGQARVNDGAGPRILGVHVVAGLEAAAVFKYGSGLPYSMTNTAGDTLIGLPNSFRLPPEYQLDLLIRRPLKIGRYAGGVYLDLRNLTNRRNVIAVRRDNGQPGLDSTTLNTLAQQAYAAHPDPIPYESPRYRRWADSDGNGYVDGVNELLPLYLSAARDFAQPLFYFGPPRLVRLGVELTF
jgi:hypothetical protein